MGPCMSEGSPLRIGVLASGRGSNFEAIARAVASGAVPGSVVAVLVSDRAEAPALSIARDRGIEPLAIEARDHPGREAHDKAILGALEERSVGLVCLAGYLRLLEPRTSSGISRAGCSTSIRRCCPRFPGLHAQRQALEYGVRVAGATVHFVDEGDRHRAHRAPGGRARPRRATPRPASPPASWPRSTGSTRRPFACSPRGGSASTAAEFISGRRHEPGAPSAHQRARQDRAWWSSPRGWRLSASRSCPPGARRASSAPRASPWWTSPRSRASPRCSTGGSRRFTRRSTAASSPAATARSTSRRSRRTASVPSTSWR